MGKNIRVKLKRSVVWAGLKLAMISFESILKGMSITMLTLRYGSWKEFLKNDLKVEEIVTADSIDVNVVQ